MIQEYISTNRHLPLPSPDKASGTLITVEESPCRATLMALKEDKKASYRLILEEKPKRIKEEEDAVWAEGMYPDDAAAEILKRLRKKTKKWKELEDIWED